VTAAARAHEASTVLELGAGGRFQRARFTLTGRTCVRGSSGGLWNEWIARFDDGRTAYLAEARGSFILYEEKPLTPAWDALVVGQNVSTDFVVVERAEAKRVARWGEVPDAPKSYRYVDLSSRDGRSATIDWGEAEPRVFVGRRVRLADLGLSPREGAPRFLPAPDVSRPKSVELWLDVGDEGKLGGTRFRVIGVLGRSIRVEGEKFTWEEYLLHDPAEGFRWLVVADGHWNLVEMIESGLVEELDAGALYEGDKYRPLSAGKARVDWASGELPWEVAIGDQTNVRDFVHAPHVLSKEWTADEITWSRGTYMPPDSIAGAFGKRALPKPVGRAPNQPSPQRTGKQSSSSRK
jgi:uncharacterized protein DUF4178